MVRSVCSSIWPTFFWSLRYISYLRLPELNVAETLDGTLVMLIYSILLPERSASNWFQLYLIWKKLNVTSTMPAPRPENGDRLAATRGLSITPRDPL